MEVFFRDLKFGNFVASEYNLIAVSIENNSVNTDDIGMSSSSDEEYIARKTIPLDYGSEHHGKLSFSITFMKNFCTTDDNEFTDFETRAILRELTGKQYYTDLYFLDDKLHYDEQVHYRAKITGTDRINISGKNVGLKFTFECDSFWAYTDEQILEINIHAGTPLYFYNSSDELNDYLYPEIQISNMSGNLTITNESDNARKTIIQNIRSNEIIELDSKNDMISSSIPEKIVLNDFNLKWTRFVPGENKLIFSSDCNVRIKYQLLRKVVI